MSHQDDDPEEGNEIFHLFVLQMWFINWMSVRSGSVLAGIHNPLLLQEWKPCFLKLWVHNLKITGPATIGLVEAGTTKKSQGFLSIHQRMCKIHHPSRQHRIHGNRDSAVRLLPNLDQVACVFYPSTATYNSKPNGPVYRETNIAEYMAHVR